MNKAKFRAVGFLLSTLLAVFFVPAMSSVSWADEYSDAADQAGGLIPGLAPIAPTLRSPGGAIPDGFIAVEDGLYNPTTGEHINQITGETTGGAGGGGGAGGEQAATCESTASTAKLACLVPGTGGMSAGEQAMFTMMMGQLVQLGGQVASIGKNMSEQCKTQADISKVMAGINGIKGAACATMVSKCESTCTKEFNRATDAARAARNANNEARAATEEGKRTVAYNAKSACASYTPQVAMMMMSAMQSMGNFAANKQCQADAAAIAGPVPTYSPIAMPTIGDCSDPNNQSLTCYCTKEANKSSVMCAGFTGGGVVGGPTTTTPNGTSVATPYASTISDLDSENTADPFAAQNKNRNGGPGGQGDGGSGAPGGGGLSALASEGGGSGGTGDGRSAITGTSGNSSGGLGSAGGGGGGGLARNNGAGGGGLMDRFNLKKFLPGSKYKTRGIAGMSVKSVDGITGPTGPSIWEKATRQYQEQIQKQNVLLDGK